MSNSRRLFTAPWLRRDMRLRLALLFVLPLAVLLASSPSQADTTWYPGAGIYGTWAFEDLWPNMGDYDLNDLVVSYQVALENSADGVNKMVLNIKPQAIGTSDNNGLGIQLPVLPSTVSQATITINGTPSTLSIESTSDTVLYLANNLRTSVAGGASGPLNTVNTLPYVPLSSITLEVTFSSAAVIPSGAVNPFIFRSGDRGHEIHLPGLPPTSLADLTIQFGEGAVDAGGNISPQYKTTEGLPWALDIPTSWQWPEEGVSVSSAYPGFAEWARSGRPTDSVWYTQPNSSEVYSPSPVPEPSTVVLLGMGAIGLLGWVWRKRK